MPFFSVAEEVTANYLNQVVELRWVKDFHFLNLVLTPLAPPSALHGHSECKPVTVYDNLALNNVIHVFGKNALHTPVRKAGWLFTSPAFGCENVSCRLLCWGGGLAKRSSLCISSGFVKKCFKYIFSIHKMCLQCTEFVKQAAQSSIFVS